MGHRRRRRPRRRIRQHRNDRHRSVISTGNRREGRPGPGSGSSARPAGGRPPLRQPRHRDRPRGARPRHSRRAQREGGLPRRRRHRAEPTKRGRGGSDWAFTHSSRTIPTGRTSICSLPRSARRSSERDNTRLQRGDSSAAQPHHLMPAQGGALVAAAEKSSHRSKAGLSLSLLDPAGCSRLIAVGSA